MNNKEHQSRRAAEVLTNYAQTYGLGEVDSDVITSLLRDIGDYAQVGLGLSETEVLELFDSASETWKSQFTGLDDQPDGSENMIIHMFKL